MLIEICKKKQLKALRIEMENTNQAMMYLKNRIDYYKVLMQDWLDSTDSSRSAEDFELFSQSVALDESLYKKMERKYNKLIKKYNDLNWGHSNSVDKKM